MIQSEGLLVNFSFLFLKLVKHRIHQIYHLIAEALFLINLFSYLVNKFIIVF